MKLNVRLLRRIQKHILREPRRLVMWTTCIKQLHGRKTFTSDNDAKQQQFAGCGTAACIAGWASLLSGVSHRANLWKHGARLLRLNVWEEESLFLVCCWPLSFANKYNTAATPLKRAKIAAARIEHFIKTGE